MTKKAAPGKFVWLDLMTTDVETSKKFYSELFGWKLSEHDMGGFQYTMIEASGRGQGGVVPLEAEHGIPSHWISYILVDDLDAALAKAQELGGKVCVPASPIPNVGYFAVVTDPQGAAFSPFKSLHEETEPEGPPAAGQWCWHELLTSDPEGAAAFYSGLYGWAVKEMDMGAMGKYRLFEREGKDVGGCMKAPVPEQRPYWMPYVACESVEATAARVAELGGKVWVPPSAIPNIGTFSVIEDPTGAFISLFRGN